MFKASMGILVSETSSQVKVKKTKGLGWNSEVESLPRVCQVLVLSKQEPNKQGPLFRFYNMGQNRICYFSVS